MTRLAKYLKPYALLIVVAVALLFIQAYSNLALPDYMSKIVNIGIQQGGVENAVPAAVRQSQMSRLVLFMTDAESKRVLSDYVLAAPGSAEAQRLVGTYPALATESVYVRKNLDGAEISALDPVMAKAWLAVSAIERAASGKPVPGLPGGAVPPAMARLFGAAGAATGGDPFAAIQTLPPAQRLAISTAMDQRLQAMGPSALIQAAAEPVKAEYAALGVNISRLELLYMLKVGGLMLILTLIAAAASIITGLISARVASGLARDLRAAVFERVENFGNAEFDKFSSASLITRSTNDIMQIQMVAVMLITMVFYAPIIGVGGIIRAVGKSSSMWWIIALAVGILMAVVLTVYRVAVPKFKIMQKLMDRLNLVSRESLSGMMVIRAFNRQRHEENRFDGANKDITDTMLFVNRVMVVMMPFMMLIMNGLTVLIIWVGAKEIAASAMQVGDMMAFMQYAI
ncbi:MAG TPA: ABC transporter permease, partial [Spirochaetia bacterium]|nr:ABC transporter permease [Spirochaetia bacterium]